MPRSPRLFFLFAWLVPAVLCAQADSLWGVWKNPSLPDSARLKAMESLAWKAVFERPDSGIVLANMLLDLAQESGSPLSVYKAHGTLAAGHKMKSDMLVALDHYEQCLTIARALKDRGRMSNTFSNMSTVYKDLGDLPKAIDLLQQSLRIDQELGNKDGMAGTYVNIGNTYKRLNEYGKALENYERGAALFNEVGNMKGRAGAMVSIGTAHSELGERDKAVGELGIAIELYRRIGNKLDRGKAHNNLGQILGRIERMKEAYAHFDTARTIFNEFKAKDPLCRNLFYTGEALLKDGRAKEAIKACELGLALADSLKLLMQQKECTECLVRAHAQAGDFRSAYAAQRSVIDLDDTLDKVYNGKEVTRLELTNAFEQQQIADSLEQVKADFEKQLEYDRQMARERTRRGFLIFSVVVVVIVAGALLGRLRYTSKAKDAIEREKDRSDELLLNILPMEVAEELKAKGEAAAVQIDLVTVLFTDFKGFTAMSETVTPKDLVRDLNECFSAFDRITEKYGIEKIKTIGDAYMAAGGLPTPNTTHATDTVMAALEMRDFIADGKARKVAAGLPYFEIRIGVHSGPVVAGIVGVKKFQYDIWGDTVNTAARMESSGEPGKVNISATTRALIGHTKVLRSEPRGLIAAKGKGDLEMYFVERA